MNYKRIVNYINNKYLYPVHHKNAMEGKTHKLINVLHFHTRLVCLVSL